jgi:hypothetical protein
MKFHLSIILGLITLLAKPQKDTLTEKPQKKISPLTISGHMEVYYCYDFARPANHERPGFFYNFSRANEVNLNFGLINVNYNSDKIRGNFGLMAGTYPQYNLANEQPLLRNLYEANFGIKLSEKYNIWIDAGIMPSHIGFESAIGNDCWNLTRSILAENTPYYESGVRLSYTNKKQKLYLAAMYLNGWQRIQRIPGNQTPAFGTQVLYKSNDRIKLNWSTFIGNEFPDSVQKWRYFNNFYGEFIIHKKFGITAGFDYGIQQSAKGSGNYDTWYSPVIIVKYSFTDKLIIAARGEYYFDGKGVMFNTGTPNGLQIYGYSVNFDYQIHDNISWRIEGRGLSNKYAIFLEKGILTNKNYFITTSFAISF